MCGALVPEAGEGNVERRSRLRFYLRIWSTNPLERVSEEIKRRARVVGTFPNPASVIRLQEHPCGPRCAPGFRRASAPLAEAAALERTWAAGRRVSLYAADRPAGSTCSSCAAWPISAARRLPAGVLRLRAAGPAGRARQGPFTSAAVRESQRAVAVAARGLVGR